MGQIEGNQPEKDNTGGAPEPQPLVSSPFEHAPGTEIRSSNKDAIARREEAVFGDSFSFAQFEKPAQKGAQKPSEGKATEGKTGESKAGEAKPGSPGEAKSGKPGETKAGNPGKASEAKPAASAEEKKTEAPKQGAEPTKKIEAAHAQQGNSQQKGVDGMVAFAREYWQGKADSSRTEGGVTGHAEALAADAMGLGVDAFEKGHDLINKVFPDGIIAPAREYWQSMAKEGKEQGGVSGTAKNWTANVMDGLLGVSGLGSVEDGVQKVVKDIDDAVPPDQLKKDVAWLGVDTALAAATFIPGVTGMKAMAKGGTAFRTAEAGTEIVGMAATKAGLTESVGSKIMTAIKEALPDVGTVTKENLGKFVDKLKGVASEYGIAIKEGGVIGESTGTMNAIAYSSKAGGPHEVAHVVQQLQTRATALEAQAARSGKTVAELSQAERAAAYENIVKPFEDIAYNQHEMWAGAAHSWGKTSGHYADVLANNVKAFEQALTTGTVPEALVGMGSKLYGALPNWLGRSQAEIAKNLGSPVANTIQRTLDKDWKDKDLI